VLAVPKSMPILLPEKENIILRCHPEAEAEGSLKILHFVQNDNPRKHIQTISLVDQKRVLALYF